MIENHLLQLKVMVIFMDFNGFWPAVLLPLYTQALPDLRFGKGGYLRS